MSDIFNLNDYKDEVEQYIKRIAFELSNITGDGNSFSEKLFILSGFLPHLIPHQGHNYHSMKSTLESSGDKLVELLREKIDEHNADDLIILCARLVKEYTIRSPFSLDSAEHKLLEYFKNSPEIKDPHIEDERIYVNDTLASSIYTDTLRRAIEQTDKTKEVIESLKSETAKTKKDFNEYVKKHSKEISDIQGDIEETYRQVGASAYEDIYTKLAEEFKCMSKFWLGFLIIASIAMIFFSYGAFLSDGAIKDIKEYVYMNSPILKLVIFGKVSVTALGIFILVWASKNYMILRHNYIVNKHRAKALEVFGALTKTALNDEVLHRAVVNKVTETVISPQPSGYLKSTVGNSDNSNNSELIQSLLSSVLGKNST